MNFRHGFYLCSISLLLGIRTASAMPVDLSFHQESTLTAEGVYQKSQATFRNYEFKENATANPLAQAPEIEVNSSQNVIETYKSVSEQHSFQASISAAHNSSGYFQGQGQQLRQNNADIGAELASYNILDFISSLDCNSSGGCRKPEDVMKEIRQQSEAFLQKYAIDLRTPIDLPSTSTNAPTSRSHPHLNPNPAARSTVLPPPPPYQAVLHSNLQVPSVAQHHDAHQILNQNRTLFDPTRVTDSAPSLMQSHMMRPQPQVVDFAGIEAGYHHAEKARVEQKLAERSQRVNGYLESLRKHREKAEANLVKTDANIKSLLKKGLEDLRAIRFEKIDLKLNELAPLPDVTETPLLKKFREGIHQIEVETHDLAQLARESLDHPILSEKLTAEQVHSLREELTRGEETVELAAKASQEKRPDQWEIELLAEFGLAQVKAVYSYSLGVMYGLTEVGMGIYRAVDLLASDPTIVRCIPNHILYSVTDKEFFKKLAKGFVEVGEKLGIATGLVGNVTAEERGRALGLLVPEAILALIMGPVEAPINQALILMAKSYVDTELAAVVGEEILTQMSRVTGKGQEGLALERAQTVAGIMIEEASGVEQAGLGTGLSKLTVDQVVPVLDAAGAVLGQGKDELSNFFNIVRNEIGLVDVDISGAIINIKEPGIWTDGRFKDPVKNAFRHWKDHKRDFQNINNALEYVEEAHRFIKDPPPGTLTKVKSQDGATVFYHPESNIFVVRDPSGAPRTMFKPSAGLSYFERQN